MPVDDNQNNETARAPIADFARKYAASYPGDDIDPDTLVQLIEAFPAARGAVTRLGFDPIAVRSSGGIIVDDATAKTLRDVFVSANKNKILINFDYEEVDVPNSPPAEVEDYVYVRKQTFDVLCKLQADDELWSELRDNFGSSWGLIDLIEEWSGMPEMGKSTFLEWLNDSMSLGLDDYFNLKFV